MNFTTRIMARLQIALTLLMTPGNFGVTTGLTFRLFDKNLCYAQ